MPQKMTLLAPSRIAMVVLLGVPIEAAAQSASAGSASDTRRVELTIGSRGSYDSNVRRSQQDLNGPVAEHRDDLIAEPRITMDVLLPFGRQSLFASGGMGYRFHLHNSFLDRENVNVTGGVRLRPLRPCLTTLATSIVRQQSDLANIFDALNPQNTETIASGSADISCATAGGLAATLGYRRTSATNSAPLRQINEYESDSVTGSIGFSRPRLGTLSLYGSYGTTRYPNRVPLNPLPDGHQGDGIQVYGAGVRYAREIGTRLTGEVSGGYMKVSPRLASVPGFKGASWAADLTYDTRNRLRASLSAARVVEASNLIGAAYSIATRWRLHADYALSPRYKLAAGVAHVRRRFEVSPLYPLPNFNSRDRTTSVYASLSAGNVGPVAIVVDAARERRKAAVPLYDYGSTRLGVTATYRFGH